MSQSDDFDELMAGMGIAKLQGGARRAPAPSKKLPPARATQASPEVRRLSAESDVLQTQLSASQQALQVAKTAIEDLEAVGIATRDRLAAETERASAAETLAATRSEEAQAAKKRVAQLKTELAAVQRQHQKAPAKVTTTAAREVFRQRNLSISSEQEEALGALALQRPRDLLDTLMLADPQPLASLLAERLVLAGPDATVPARDDRVVARVAEQRCEVGGASDVDAAWLKFMPACAARKITTITIVGGSVAYRKALRRLAGASSGVKLTLVSGTKRRDKRKAESDLRGSDLVVVWGGTELDHSVSGAYTGTRSDKVVTIVHRGLSGMLARATRALSQQTGDET